MSSATKTLAAVRRLTNTPSFRGFRTSSQARGNPGDPEYIHAKEMYAIRDISSPKLVYGMAVAAVVGVGVSIPLFAVNFQQGKR